jgi:hypothetical protein
MSVSGFIVLLSLVLAGVLLGPRRDLFTMVAALVLLFITAIVILIPNNYVIIQMQALLSGNWTVSVLDRFYSTFGPVVNALSSYVLLGYGLGGTVTHFQEIVPPVAQSAIAGIRWETMPMLNNLIGRLLAETGLVGLLLFAVTILISLRELRTLYRVLGSKPSALSLKVARLALFAFLVGSMIGYGSFAWPYLWFWLAFIDSRYLINIKINLKGQREKEHLSWLC